MAPPDTPLLPAPPAPLLLAAPVPAWKKRIKPLSAGLLAAVLVVAFLIGWFVHHRDSSAARESSEQRRDTTPITTVVAVRRSPTLSELLLPGSLSPITEASLYARASGYVLHRYVDIGDIVRKGQVLADIDSPELDAQVAQGRAALAQARQQADQAIATIGDDQARVDLAQVTVQRYETLLAQDSIARQDVDVQRQTLTSAVATLNSGKAAASAAQANVGAAKANLDRLNSLQQFEKLRAPFAGVITARNVDEGALISSAGASLSSSTSQGSSSSGGSGSTGSSSGSSSALGGDSSSMSSSSGTGGTTGSSAELFRIAQVDRLRVYVNVPQDNASAVQIGADANVLVQQFAQRFTGRITRTAHAIDPTARTLLTEVQIPNGDGALMPGMYAQVRLSSQRSSPPLLVPGETLIARAGGTSIATLVPLSDDERRKLADADARRCARKIHMQPVVEGRDYGTDVEIVHGLRPDDVLVLDPSDAVRENAIILPELQKKQDGDSGGSAQGGAGGASGGSGGGGSAGSSGGASGGQGGGQSGGKKKDDAKQQAQKEQQRRRAVEQTCIDDQVRQARAAEPAASSPGVQRAPAGGASAVAGNASAPTVGGPSDRDPGGIQSPSEQAPTQGPAGGSAKGKSK